MTQELIDLRASILEQRYDDALAIIDELEWMSKKQILQTIESFLVRILVHLIKNQIEQRLTNSWAASIEGSIIKIRKLNLKENKTSYYIEQDEWDDLLEEAFNESILPASAEIFNGEYSPKQLMNRVNMTQVIASAKKFLDLTYSYSNKELPYAVKEQLSELPGGKDWELGRKDS
jgi:Domain of unknown function DUF29